MPDKSTTTIANLPEEVVEFLSSFEMFTFVQDFLKKYGVDDVLEFLLQNLIEGMVLRKHELSELPKLLENELGIASEKSKAAATELSLETLLPIEGIVGDVSGFITGLGGTLPEKKEQLVPKMTAEDFVKAFLKENQVEMDTPNHQHRLVLAISNFAKGEKTKDELKNLLTRDIGVGGLNLEVEDASLIMDKIEKTLNELQLAFSDKDDELPTLEKVSEPKKKVDAVKLASKAESGTRPSTFAPSTPQESRSGNDAPPTKEGVPETNPNPVPAAKPELIPTPKLTPKPKAVPSPEPTPVPVQKPRVELAPAPVAKAPAPEASKSVSSAKPARLDSFDDDDEKEIAEHVGRTKKIQSEIEDPLLDMDEAMDRIVTASGLTFENTDRKARFEKAVESRLRDVRDAYETRNQLESSIEQGGLGLKGEELARVSAGIEDIVGQYRTSIASKKTEEAQARQVQLRKEREARTKQKEQEDQAAMAKRYQKIAKKAGVAPGREQEVDTETLKKAVQGVSTVTPKYSMPTVHPTGKPKLQDVRFERRLAGPIDELGQLDPTEFRRLSRFPKEAVMKIKDRIDLLGTEGFEQKIAGIKAWRKSPTNKLYLSLAQEAFLAGKSLSDVIKEKETAGAQTLSEAEIQAIIGLNAELRF